MTEVLLFIGLLVFSGFFSGSETAFFSLSKAHVREFRASNDASARRVVRLLDRPRDLLVGILVGNTIVNTAAASIAAITVHKVALAFSFDPLLALLLQIAGVTFVLIVLVEISPKVFALRHNVAWAKTLSGPIRFFMVLLWPLTKMFVAFTEQVARLAGVEATRVLFNEEELRTLAEVSEEHGLLEEDEREMIHSIFEFGETEVHEIMVPRIDMISIASSVSVRDAAEVIRDCGHSRIPVFDSDVDHIVGILYAKDLIGKDTNGSSSESIAPLLREAFFVPESKRISSLLREFQKDKIHMAIVVDEYGGTEGLITMEDVIEEIVGDIHDEYDTEEQIFQLLEDGQYQVMAKMEVSEFNRRIGEDLVPTEEDYETLGGFIFYLAGEVPLKGSRFLHEGWGFTVNGVEGNRVLDVIVQPPEDVKNGHADE